MKTQKNRRIEIFHEKSLLINRRSKRILQVQNTQEEKTQYEPKKSFKESTEIEFGI